MADPILDAELDLDGHPLGLLDRHKLPRRFDPQYYYGLLAVESAVESPGNVLLTAGRNRVDG